MPELRKYDQFMLEKGREDVLKRVQEAYDRFLETKLLSSQTGSMGSPSVNYLKWK
jgi:hypothetical protein